MPFKRTRRFFVPKTSVPEQREENDNRDWHAEKPEKDTSTHVFAPI